MNLHFKVIPGGLLLGPFISAVKENDLDFTRVFLDNNRIDLDEKDEEGVTVLIHAAARGYTSMVKDLLAHGANPNVIGTNAEITALMAAIENSNINTNNNINVIRVLLEHPNLDPNIGDPLLGSTALMGAVVDGKLEIAKELLKNEKTDPNLKNKFGATALMMAIQGGNVDIINALLGNPKVDPNIMEDMTGNTVLISAVMDSNCNIEIIRALLKNPRVDPNVMNIFGSALMWAIEKNNIDVVKLFLKNPKLDLNKRALLLGRTALTTAAEKGNVDIVRELLAYKRIDINIGRKTSFLQKSQW